MTPEQEAELDRMLEDLIDCAIKVGEADLAGSYPFVREVNEKKPAIINYVKKLTETKT